MSEFNKLEDSEGEEEELQRKISWRNKNKNKKVEFQDKNDEDKNMGNTINVTNSERKDNKTGWTEIDGFQNNDNNNKDKTDDNDVLEDIPGLQENYRTDKGAATKSNREGQRQGGADQQVISGRGRGGLKKRELMYQ